MQRAEFDPFGSPCHFDRVRRVEKSRPRAPSAWLRATLRVVSRGSLRAGSGAPWNCPRFPPQRYGPTGATTLNKSARMACSTAPLLP